MNYIDELFSHAQWPGLYKKRKSKADFP